MVPLWRLTRNRYGRATYNLLGRVGITATRMDQYTAEVETEGSREAVSAASEFEVGIAAPDDLPGGAGSVHGSGDPFAELGPEERLLAAVSGDEVAGYLFVSVDENHHIHPLETDIAFEGGYVRRLYVDPDYRQRGLATTLVDRACRVVADAGATQVHALVALDNRPSQWVFESCGFERRRRYAYVRVLGCSRRSVTDLG